VNSPFVSREAELVFYLTQLDGKKRNELLGITEAHYEDRELAEEWHNSIYQHVKDNKEAIDSLAKIYSIMISS
jgi:hypothetical protein